MITFRLSKQELEGILEHQAGRAAMKSYNTLSGSDQSEPKSDAANEAGPPPRRARAAVSSRAPAAVRVRDPSMTIKHTAHLPYGFTAEFSWGPANALRVEWEPATSPASARRGVARSSSKLTSRRAGSS